MKMTGGGFYYFVSIYKKKNALVNLHYALLRSLDLKQHRH